jgi:hypothetical protein
MSKLAEEIPLPAPPYAAVQLVSQTGLSSHGNEVLSDKYLFC